MEGRPRELRDYLRVLVRQARLVAAVTAAVVVVAVGVAVAETPTYEATAELLFESSSARATIDPAQQAGGDPNRALANEVQFIESALVSDTADDRTGLDGEVSAAVAQPSGDVIVVSARSSNAEEAAEIVNAHAAAYLDERRQQGVEEYRETVATVEANLEEVQRIRFDAATRLSEVEAQLAASAPDDDVTGLVSERNALEATLNSTLEQVIALDADLRELDLGADLAATDVATVTNPATPPGAPISPNPIRNGAVGVVVGLVIGVGAAFLRDYFADGIADGERLDAILGGRAPILGEIPTISPGPDAHGGVITIDRPQDPASEAYRTLRTVLELLDTEPMPRVIHVTSPEAGDGKSTTAVNLAAAMAETGGRVLVVDGDLHRPGLDEVLGVANDVGVTALADADALDDAIQEVPAAPGLSVLPAGPTTGTPPDLTASDKLGPVLDELRDRYDSIVVDSPPLLGVSDTLALTRLADAVLLVVSAEGSSAPSVERALAAAERVGAPIIGVVLNRSADTARYYEYGASTPTDGPDGPLSPAASRI